MEAVIHLLGTMDTVLIGSKIPIKIFGMLLYLKIRQ